MPFMYSPFTYSTAGIHLMGHIVEQQLRTAQVVTLTMMGANPLLPVQVLSPRNVGAVPDVATKTMPFAVTRPRRKARAPFVRPSMADMVCQSYALPV